VDAARGDIKGAGYEAAYVEGGTIAGIVGTSRSRCCGQALGWSRLGYSSGEDSTSSAEGMRDIVPYERAKYLRGMKEPEALPRRMSSSAPPSFAKIPGTFRIDIDSLCWVVQSETFVYETETISMATI
jgi:hypothetical protein